MTFYDQGGLYYLNLKSLKKLSGDFIGHTFEMEVVNICISDRVFVDTVCRFFSEHTVQIIADGFLITGTMNAEEMTDGENDFSDEKRFLEKMSQSLLDKFKELPGWGENGGPDRSAEYNLLD